MLAEQIAHKMDDLQSKSEMISSLQESLYISIFCQDAFLKTDFEEAFILLGIMISEIAEELKELTDFAFENLRKAGDAHEEYKKENRNSEEIV